MTDGTRTLPPRVEQGIKERIAPYLMCHFAALHIELGDATEQTSALRAHVENCQACQRHIAGSRGHN